MTFVLVLVRADLTFGPTEVVLGRVCWSKVMVDVLGHYIRHYLYGPTMLVLNKVMVDVFASNDIVPYIRTHGGRPRTCVFVRGHG